MSECICSAGVDYDWDWHSDNCPVYMRGRIAELESREVTGEPTEQDYELWARNLAGQPWDDVPAGARSMFIGMCKSVWSARRSALQEGENND